MRSFIREAALDASTDAIALIQSYVTDKLNSIPDVGRELGLWRYAGAVASRDPGVRAGRRQRLQGYIKSARSLLRDASGDIAFDLNLLVFDARKELHGLRSTVEGLSTRECDRLFDVSNYIEREFAPAHDRAEALRKHVHAAANEVQSLLSATHASMHEVLESIRGTLLGYHEYYGNDVRQFLRASGGDASAADEGMRSISSIIEWVDAAIARGDTGHIMGESKLIDMIRETEGIVTTVADLQRSANIEIRRCQPRLFQALSEMGLSPDVRGLREATLSRVSDAVGVAAKQVPELHAFLLKARVVDVPMIDEIVIAPGEAFKPWSTAYVDYPGPFDGDRRAFYRIAIPDASNMPYEELLLLTTVHEVYPGHALQHATQQQGRGSMIRHIAKSSTFSEGWAHYTESLALEAGLRDRRPLVRIAQLQKSLLRACRVLATIELHVNGRHIDDVVRMFETIAFVDPLTAKKQAYRGIVEPGYLSYLTGKERILRMRQRFLGSGLGDINEFHRWLLSHGAPPLPLLARELHEMATDV